MVTVTPEYAHLRGAVTERFNAHDLLGVMDRTGVRVRPEMEDFAALITAGTPITPEVVATGWHKWFGDSSGNTNGEPEPPTAGMGPWQLICRLFKATS